MTLLGLFVVLTLIHIPLYNSYYNYGNFFGDDFDFLTQLSLGNLGYSKTECSMSSMIEGDQKEIICKTGLIVELVDWGITTDFEDQMKCVKKGEDICSPVLNMTAMSEVF